MIIGIDYSITSPAITVQTPSGPKFFAYKQKSKQECWNPDVTYLDPIAWSTPEERYYRLCGGLVESVLKLGTPDVAYIEAYAFGASGLLLNIAEATSVIKQKLNSLGCKIVPLAPSSVKKFATGKGNAKKDAMLRTFMSNTGSNPFDWFGVHENFEKIPSPITDIVDSYFVLQAGLSGISK